MSKTRALLERSPTAWGVGLALVGAVFFSGKAIVVKLAYVHGVDAATLLAMRMLLSLPLFLLALLITTWRDKHAAKMSSKDLVLVVLAGLLGYYLASLLDFMGLAYITAGLERLILFTYPSMVLLITCMLRRQWPHRSQMLCMALSYIGLAVVYGNETVSIASNTALGAALVFASAICYAAYLLIGERLLKNFGTIRVTAMATLVSSIAILVQVGFQQPLGVLLNQPAAVWGWSLVNAVFCTFVPVFSVMTAMSLIGASRVAQIGMVGPVSTLVLGTFLLGEPFTVWHAVGTALVILGVAILNIKSRGGVQAVTKP